VASLTPHPAKATAKTLSAKDILANRFIATLLFDHHKIRQQYHRTNSATAAYK
jgi:hypothetical protein